ncbi:MAG: tRNA lysidine(34) synthetase TilS [Clostridia bacterium]|nr:tRNA lysidine(34) synthetase TilS [Clostridia bacterium]
MDTSYLFGKKVAVAVSGGVDSVVLLDNLAKNAQKDEIELCVINVDHNIRAESASDSLFVKNLAKKYGLEFFGFSVNALEYAKQHKLSEETAARILRYKVFDEFKDADYIALAHHMSDQAETILMHILRGSGAKGAVGMKQMSGRYVRPLLDVSKEEILQYASENNIEYVVDQTNFDNDKTRNYLRNEIFPLLKKVNSRVTENICRFGKNISGDQQVLDDLADEQNLDFGDGFVQLPDSVADEGFGVFLRCVFKAMAYLGIHTDIESKHVNDVFALYDKQSGCKIDLPYNLRAYRDYEGVTIMHWMEKEKLVHHVDFALEPTMFGDKMIEITNALPEDGLYFDGDKLPEGCVLRHRQNGDVFTKFGGGTKKLKEFLIDKKIPARERDDLVLVAKDNEVFIVCGVEISDKIKVDKNSQNIFGIAVR